MEFSKHAASFAELYKEDISSDFIEEIQFLKSIHTANLIVIKSTIPGEVSKLLDQLEILNKLNTSNLLNLFPNV